MAVKDDLQKELILEQYKSYCASKDSFSDRNFTTNRFYASFTFILLAAVFVLTLLTPSIGIVLTVAAIGLCMSIMWWINIDTYQVMIKIKFARVIEVLEEMLPVQPCKLEFQEFQNVKHGKKAIIFSDMQKFYTLFITCIFTFVFVRYAYLWVFQTRMSSSFSGM